MNVWPHQDAKAGYEKAVGDQLVQDDLMVSDVFGAVHNVVHHKCAYIGVCLL